MPLSATDQGRKLRDMVGTDRPQLTTEKSWPRRGHTLRLETQLWSSDKTPPGSNKRVSQKFESWHGLLVSTCGATDHSGSRWRSHGFTDGCLLTRQRGARAFHNPPQWGPDWAVGERGTDVWGRDARVGADNDWPSGLRCGSGSDTGANRSETGRGSEKDPGGERGCWGPTTEAGGHSMDSAGAAASHQGILLGRGNLGHRYQGRVAAMHLQHLPMEDGAGGRVPLHLLRRFGQGGGRGKGPEESQDLANEGTRKRWTS